MARLGDVVDLKALALLASRRATLGGLFDGRDGTASLIDAAVKRILPALKGLRADVAIVALEHVLLALERPIRVDARRAVAEIYAEEAEAVRAERAAKEVPRAFVG